MSSPSISSKACDPTLIICVEKLLEKQANKLSKKRNTNVGKTFPVQWHPWKPDVCQIYDRRELSQTEATKQTTGHKNLVLRVVSASLRKSIDGGLINVLAVKVARPTGLDTLRLRSSGVTDEHDDVGLGRELAGQEVGAMERRTFTSSPARPASHV